MPTWSGCWSAAARAEAAMRSALRRAALAPLLLVVALAATQAARTAFAADLPIFDAHLHYSQDAWDSVPPKEAIALLRKAGLKRALISSSGDEGQQRLRALAPDLVIAELRPYRSRGEIGSWS